MFKRTRNLALLLIGGLICCSTLQAQLRVSKQQVEEDILKFKTLLKLFHPNAQSVDFDKEFDLHQSQLNIKDTVTNIEAYRLISSFMPVIKDGHTQVNLPIINWALCTEMNSFFPLEVHWDGSDLYLIKHLKQKPRQVSKDSLKTKSKHKTPPPLKPGDKILAINGMKSSEFVEEMINSLMRDNYNLNYPIWVINNYFLEYFTDLYGCHQSYHIEYQDTSKQVNQTTIEGMSGKLYALLRTDNQNSAVDLSIKDKIGTLAIKTWNSKTSKKEYQQKLKTLLSSKFEEIIDSDIENLIIDLRDNQGGNIKHSILTLSYLLDQPYEIFQSVRRVKKGELTTFRSGKLGMHEPGDKQFTGNLYILINGGSFSNTVIFSTALRKYNRATFIGSETGGSSHVFCFTPYKFKLKHTRFPVKIPTVQAKLRPIDDKTHGILPDHEVKPTIQDLIDEKDAVMDFTIDLIKKQALNN